MKFTQEQRKGKRARAQEVIQPEHIHEREYFDPRFDLPKGETGRLLTALQDPERLGSQDRRKAEALIWLSAVDPSYEELLRGFVRPLTLDLAVHLRGWQEGVRTDDLQNALYYMSLVFQLKPELREHFPDTLRDPGVLKKAIDEVDAKTDLTQAGDRSAGALRVIQLWPEQSERLKNHFFPPERRLQDLLSDLDRATHIWDVVTQAATLCLMFPELRQNILKEIWPKIESK